MSRTELIFTDEEIDRVAEKIASKLSKPNSELLSYGLVAKYKTCEIYFDLDENANDIFLIKDNNGNIIGKFVEENDNIPYLYLLEAAAEEIENLYGRETDLSNKLRYIVNQQSEYNT